MELAFITGASQGYGRQLAVEFAKRKKAQNIPITVVLSARSEENLKETQKLVREIIDEKSNSEYHVIDYSKLDNLEGILVSVLSKHDASKYKKVYLFNNAGAFGEVGKVSDLKDFSNLRSTIDFNLTSVIITTTLFLRHFRGNNITNPPSAIVVNISSKVAVEPFVTWTSYCVPKAARNMFHRVLAAEEKEEEVKTLNWGPGMMDTGIQDAVQNSPVYSASKEFLGKLFKEKQGIPLDASTSALFDILEKNEYKSGEHLDVYDFKPEYLPKI